MILRINLDDATVRNMYDATYAMLEKLVDNRTVQWTVNDNNVTVFYKDYAFNIDTLVKNDKTLRKIVIMTLRSNLLRLYAKDSAGNMIHMSLEGYVATLQMSNPENQIITFGCDFKDIKFEHAELNIKSTDIVQISNAIGNVLSSLTEKCTKENN